MTKQYVRQVGSSIHDINDNPFILKGVGIGGWLLLEGYMVQSYKEIDRPRRFHKHIAKMVGTELKDYFFEKWYRLFFTEDDVKLIKNSGFNSIRIPIDYQFLYHESNEKIELDSIEEHYKILTTIIDLCHKYELYVILDLHAAPGGQTGTNIDNSMQNKPELFTNMLYQEQLLFIWKDIASRYKDETYIAAYDLLNEPLPNWFSQYNELLIPLYEKVISAIRTVDPNHMITIEGLHWSTDWSCFTHLPDDNILLQFHKYWSNPDQESIEQYLNVRDTLNVPIIMGEGGENNLYWYSSVFTMYEQLDISYNFWTYKKMKNTNSIITFHKPLLWNEFLEGTLSEKDSILVLQTLLQNISSDDAKVNQSCINHILRVNHMIIPAYGYDYYGKGIAFYNVKNHQSSMRTKDNIHLTNRDGNIVTPNFKHYNGEDVSEEERIHLTLHKNEWVQYTVNIPSYKANNLIIDCSDKTAIKINIQNRTSNSIIRLTATNKVIIKQLVI